MIQRQVGRCDVARCNAVAANDDNGGETSPKRFKPFGKTKQMDAKDDLEETIPKINEGNAAFLDNLMNGENSEGFWKFAVLLIAFSWATNFPVIKAMYDAAPELDPSLYSAMRFGLAGTLFSPFLGNLAKMDFEEAKVLVWESFLIGLVLFLGYYGQANGLIESTAGKGAFICTLQIVWVALWKGYENQKFAAKTWVAVALAIAGTALLELQGSQAPVWGDAWLMLQPIGFGSGYVLLERVIRKFPNQARAITAVKLGSVGILCSLWATAVGHTWEEVKDVVSQPVALQALSYTGIVTTAATIWLQSVAFKRVSADDASIIIATEPVWAASVAYLGMGETMSSMDMSGAALILMAGLSNELDVFDKIGLGVGDGEGEGDE